MQGMNTGAADQKLSAILVGIAQDLFGELHHGRQARRADLAMSLDHDWGFDSLSRAELFLRIERRLRIDLPLPMLAEAATLDDVRRAIASSPDILSRPLPRPVAPAHEAAEPAPETVQTLIGALDWHAARHGDRTHLIISDNEEVRISYAALSQAARQVAHGLRQAGLSPGERVAIMLPTGPAFFKAFFGILHAGAVPVPIYPPARATQIGEHLQRQAHILGNAGAVMLITDMSARAVARLLRLQVGSLRQIETVEELSASGGGALPRVTSGDMALLQYTSGSTGDPKGVVLTHANLLANIRAMGAVIAPTANDVFVSWLPLYHDMGLIGAWLGSLYYAVPLVVMSPLRFLVRPERWLWAINHYRGTLSAAPNFAFDLCIRKIEEGTIEGLDLSSLRMVANGAEAVSADTIQRFTERFGPYGFQPGAMAPVYGLAENGVGVAFPPPGRPPIVDRIDRRLLGREGRAVPVGEEVADALTFVACGRPLPGHEVRIVGATGELGERQEGRLQFRGPSATRGYFDNAPKNRELFDGDWLNSGDLAYVAAGDIFVTGRSKDILIRAGEHIYPQEVEDAVNKIPGIRKGCVVVFGLPDPRTGTERIVIVAETRERDGRRVEELKQQVMATAAGLLEAAPDEIILVPPHVVPKTSSGKIRRTAARQLYEAGKLGRVRASLWRQVLLFILASLLPGLRQLSQTSSALAYAGYWWTVIGMLGASAWLLVLALRTQPARWAVVCRLARLALLLLGIRLSVDAPARLPRRAIMVSNHASYVDSLVLAAILPGTPTFVAKRELASQLIAGSFLRALGTIFVQANAPQSDISAEKAVLAGGEGNRYVVVFPEGRIQRAPGLMPFQLGAFLIAAEAAVPIVPIALHGTRTVLRSGQWLPRRGTVDVAIGAPIMPEGRDFTAAVRLRDRARAMIAARCGEPEAIET